MSDLNRLIKRYRRMTKYLIKTAKEFTSSQDDELMLQAARYENVAKEYALIADALYALREKKEREPEGKR